MLEGFSATTRPIDRSDIAEWLIKISPENESLSTTDRRLLLEYRVQYRKELSDEVYPLIKEKAQVYWPGQDRESILAVLQQSFRYEAEKEDYHFLVWESEDELIWIDWEEMLRVEAKNQETRFITQDYISFSAQIQNSLGIFFDARRYIQSSNPNWPEPSEEYKGSFLMELDEMGGVYNFDYSTAYIRHKSVFGNIELSSYPILWGNSPNSLILSDNAQSFAHIAWQKSFYKSRFSFFHGFLLPSEYELDSLSLSKIYKEKYIVGHRWEIQPMKKLHLAFSEMLIYGNRDIDFIYMLPTVFLWSAEHNQNDRDNILLAVEAEYSPFNNLKLYGTILLDELRFSELFNDWWANKQAYQFGLYYVPKLQTLSTDFRLEFTAVRPWVYTHKYDYNSYTHNSVVLGFPAGPNSRQVFFENRWWMGTRHQMSISFLNLEKGLEEISMDDPDYYPVGSDANQNYNERNLDFDNKTSWLMGEVQTEHILGFNYHYVLSNTLLLQTVVKYAFRESENYLYYSFQLKFLY